MLSGLRRRAQRVDADAVAAIATPTSIILSVTEKGSLPKEKESESGVKSISSSPW